jgi:hypothetical protein
MHTAWHENLGYRLIKRTQFCPDQFIELICLYLLVPLNQRDLTLNSWSARSRICKCSVVLISILSFLKESGKLNKYCRLRQIKYHNNIIENDHKSVKRQSRYRQWYQSFDSASATISGMKTMRMIQKGQIKYIDKQNICPQNKFINALFGLAA